MRLAEEARVTEAGEHLPETEKANPPQMTGGPCGEAGAVVMPAQITAVC